MNIKHVSLAVALAASGLAANAQAAGAGSTAPSSGSGQVISTKPAYTESMQKLQQSADRLRQSIQALAQKKPGPDRDAAIDEANKALMETQQAMVALPPELRSWGSVSNTDYDASVKKLMAASDSLRKAIQEMAQQPAGERRNRAVQQANKALIDTQSAMVSAYQPRDTTRSMGSSSGSGSGSSSGTGATSSR